MERMSNYIEYVDYLVCVPSYRGVATGGVEVWYLQYFVLPHICRILVLCNVLSLISKTFGSNEICLSTN